MSAQASPAAPSHASASAHSEIGRWRRIRRDKPWWVLPLTVVLTLGGFSVYAFWTAALGGLSEWRSYLSPFYSPRLGTVGGISPAIWVVGFPLAFRGSCYYYRKSYYRSFFWDPPACGVGERRRRPYRGETRLPLSLNNLHRYAMYAAVVILAFLWIDAAEAFSYRGHMGIGLGSVIMLANVVLLSGYTFGCHSLRHLAGGGLDCYSCVRGGNARHRAWKALTVFNARHAIWAWLSMFSVVGVDVYIRLLQHHVFADPHLGFGF